jgi:hypothetical protein
MRLLLALTLTAGCPNQDAGEDAGPDAQTMDARPDASPGPDARPDAMAPDAEEMDATEMDAAEMDASEIDTGVDSGTPDTGVPLCATSIPRLDACQDLGGAVARYAQRCNPELTQAEADHLGSLLCSLAPILDPALAYTATAAGACCNDLSSVPCDVPNPVTALATCSSVVTGTIAAGGACRSSTYCQPGNWCRGAPIGTGVGGCFLGVCEPQIPPNDPCSGSEPGCTRGHACSFGKGGNLCLPLAPIGGSCDVIPCEGAVDYLLFPTADCIYQGLTGAFECEGLGRAGASCTTAPCHPLYACDGSSETCLLKPGPGDPCTPSIDVANPDPAQLAQLHDEALYECRIPAFAPIFGDYCTQTGTTTGQATCLPVPGVGAACGFGQNLAAICRDGFCPGVADPAPFMATCSAPLPIGFSCDALDPTSFGYECAPPAFCFDPSGKSGLFECYSFGCP